MPKASKQRVRGSEASKGIKFQVPGLSFGEISGEIVGPSPWRRLFELVAVLIAFLAGASSILTFALNPGSSVSQMWKIALISAATLCVGFGVAALFYGRLREQEARILRADFQSLRSRAEKLVTKFDDFERSKRKS